MNWNASKSETETITKIAKRAVQVANSNGISLDFMDTQMDIAACHLNGNPLKLEDLYNADDLNFAHDIFGIKRHLNRNNGELEDCFLPRFSCS